MLSFVVEENPLLCFKYRLEDTSKRILPTKNTVTSTAKKRKTQQKRNFEWKRRRKRKRKVSEGPIKKFKKNYQKRRKRKQMICCGRERTRSSV